MERPTSGRVAGALAPLPAGLLAGALFFGWANVLPAVVRAPAPAGAPR